MLCSMISTNERLPEVGTVKHHFKFSLTFKGHVEQISSTFLHKTNKQLGTTKN